MAGANFNMGWQLMSNSITSPHYFPMMPREYLEATAGYNLEEKGAYLLLLLLIYKNNGRCPDNSQYIAGNLGCSVRRWNQIKDFLLAENKIFIDGNYIFNDKASEIVADINSKRLARGAGGRAPRKTTLSQDNPDIISGLSQDYLEKNEPDTNKNNNIAGQKPLDTRALESESDIESSTNVDASKKKTTKREAKERHKFPIDFELTEGSYNFAKGKGFDDAAISLIKEQFIAHYQKKLDTDKQAYSACWQASWRTWIINEVKYSAERRAKTGNSYSRNRVEGFYKAGMGDFDGE